MPWPAASAASALLALSWTAVALAQTGSGAVADSLASGRTLYLEGKRGDGTALLARRAGGLSLRGAEAACVNCHRRSGFGGSEGRSYIPPINASSLFEAKAPGSGASAAGTGRPAYNAQTLARAVRSGIDAGGRGLEYLMPRYELSDAEVAALVAHLGQLSTQPAPGVSAAVLDFATVVAPGMDPMQSKAMLDVLGACFDEHNAAPPPVRGRKRLGPEMSVGAKRPWRLAVWALTGPPETWGAQLAEYQRQRPVFAVVGGLGGGNWAPVHAFCEASALPCLFPRVELAGADAPGFYALYLNRGVQLDAAIIARDLTDGGHPVQHVVQVMRAGDEGARAGADALRRLLSGRGIAVEDRLLDGTARHDAGLFEVAAAQALVLWLRDEDLRRLEAVDPVAPPVYLSATLADPERAALPAAWKARALLAYPYELPEKRAGRTARLHAWLQAHALSPVDEPVQADAYLACAALGVGMNEIADHLQRDYLVERLEVVTERGGFTGPYPRLALGAGQRFASKTGYLVRFAGPESGRLVPVGERIAP